jgi:amino acid adenylation domain-containing protein
MLMHQLLEHTARATPDRTALVTDGQRFTYAEVDARADALAAALQAAGVERGDRVATCLDNGLDAVVCIYAAMKCGAVLMAVNPLTKRQRLAAVLNDARASVLVTHAGLLDEVGAALATNRSVHTCWVAGEMPQPPGDTRCRPMPATAPGDRPAPVPTIDQDLAAIIYTSGSTGEPKGVMLSHLNMVSAARSVNAYLQLTADDVVFSALPHAYSYGLYQVLSTFMVGGTLVLERSFSFPVKVLQQMAREGVTVFPGVPTVFARLLALKTLADHPVPTLRIVTSAAAALPDAHIQGLRAAFPQAKLYAMYGQTECKRVTYLPPELLDERPGSVGRGMPNQEMWLEDEAGRRLPFGSTGELVVRGSHVMRGYWEKPEATARALRPGPYPGEMVLHSGDIFRTDSDGYFWFVSRKDELIKVRGEKVSPRDIENVLCAMPGVLEAAAIGCVDAVVGEAVKAFVALQPGHVLTERQVIQHCASRLETVQVPRHVVFVDELPKTDSGKIRKAGLV